MSPHEPHSPAPAAALPIALNLPNWERECRRIGLSTDRQRAAALDTTRQTVCLIQGGHRTPSQDFIANALELFYPAHFEDLFVSRRRRNRARGVA